MNKPFDFSDMPKVKHTILKWARETSHYSLEEAAHKLGFTDSKVSSAAEKLAAYEDGEKEPSRSLLIRMSKQYHRSLLTFYLDQPPSIGDRGEDFRTLPVQFKKIENTYVDVLIRDIKSRQSTVREALIDADEENLLDFIGKHNTSSGIARVVQTIRETLNISLDAYRSQPSHKEAFRFLRQHAEMAGVFVLLKGNLGSYHSDIEVTVFRGFALSDDIAPFIIINDRDAEAAWSFTLLHEMAHLVLGKTGISGAYAEKQIEKFCNDVASEFLLPESELKKFQVTGHEIETLKSEISEYAFDHKLSSSHIAYRLFRRGDVDKSLWDSLREYYRNSWIEKRNLIKVKNRQKEGGPSYYTVKHYKLGALVELVQRLTYAGSLTTTKAGMLLDVKPLKVHRLFESGQTA
ncbi:MAG: XRE family transcriptional regulator [Candidatus Thiodiazotropha sp.]